MSRVTRHGRRRTYYRYPEPERNLGQATVVLLLNKASRRQASCILGLMAPLRVV